MGEFMSEFKGEFLGGNAPISADIEWRSSVGSWVVTGWVPEGVPE